MCSSVTRLGRSNPQAGYAVELSAVVGDNDQPLRVGVPGDHLVIRADLFAQAGQLNAELTSVDGSLQNKPDNQARVDVGFAY